MSSLQQAKAAALAGFTTAGSDHLSYGCVSFASKAGPLAGSHFATVVEGNENLRAMGTRLLWEGAQGSLWHWGSGACCRDPVRFGGPKDNDRLATGVAA